MPNTHPTNKQARQCPQPRLSCCSHQHRRCLLHVPSSTSPTMFTHSASPPSCNLPPTPPTAAAVHRPCRPMHHQAPMRSRGNLHHMAPMGHVPCALLPCMAGARKGPSQGPREVPRPPIARRPPSAARGEAQGKRGGVGRQCGGAQTGGCNATDAGYFGGCGWVYWGGMVCAVGRHSRM